MAGLNFMKGAHPTAQQLEAVRVVKAIRLQTGNAPNARDVAAVMGISRQGASRLLRACGEKGLLGDIPIEVSSGKWDVTPDGERWLKLRR